MVGSLSYVWWEMSCVALRRLGGSKQVDQARIAIGPDVLGFVADQTSFLRLDLCAALPLLPVLMRAKSLILGRRTQVVFARLKRRSSIKRSDLAIHSRRHYVAEPGAIELDEGARLEDSDVLYTNKPTHGLSDEHIGFPSERINGDALHLDFSTCPLAVWTTWCLRR